LKKSRAAKSDFSELEMYYSDTMRAALWIILAVMVLWSVVSTVLVGLAQRFTSQEKNKGNSVRNAPRPTPMRRALYPTKFAELYRLLLLAGVVVTGVTAHPARAFDAQAINASSPGHPWCVTREGSSVAAACEYNNFLACGMAAIMAGGSCKERLSLSVTERAAPLPRPRRPAAAKPPLQKRAAAAAPISGNNELFRKFVRWSSGAQLSEPQSTTILVPAEPGAVVSSTKPGPSEAKPAKPEHAAVEPSTQQAHYSRHPLRHANLHRRHYMEAWSYENPPR
jgi:hypothetical protein